MLTSELALELGIDSTAFAKRMQTYWFEAKVRQERHLSAETVERVTAANELLANGEAKTFKEAVQRVLGTYAAPIPSGTAAEILQRLTRLEAAQQETVEKVSRLLTHVEAAMGGQPSNNTFE